MRKRKGNYLWAVATKQRDGTWWPWASHFGYDKTSAKLSYRLKYGRDFKSDKALRIKRFLVVCL